MSTIFAYFVKYFLSCLRKADKSMFSTFEIVKDLCEKQGISLNTLEDKLKLGKNSLYGLKRNQPSAERLQQIADYFNVSTDYLLGRTDNPAISSDLVTTADGRVVDLSNLRERIVLFDGKPLSDDDVDKIAQIIKLSLGVSDIENK
nr:MAG TPA: repressor protein [Caudoviricetes sp.]